MTKPTAQKWTRGCLAAGALLLVPAFAAAQVTPEGDPVAALTFGSPDLAIGNIHQPLSRLPEARTALLQQQLGALGVEATLGFYDVRAGHWGTLLPAAPLVPGSGRGNGLSWGISGAPADDAAYKDAVGRAFKGWIEAHRAALGIDTAELGPATIGSHEDGRLVHVTFDRVVNGVPVRGSRIKGTLNNGNLVLYGAENWGTVDVATTPRLSSDQARAVVADHLSAFNVTAWRRSQLLILPVSSGPGAEAAYGHRLVWAVGPRVEDSLGTWEGLVDAHSGDLVSFSDTNAYLDQKKVIGGIFPVSNDGQSPAGIPDGVEQPAFPMSRAYVYKPDGTRLTANSEGLVQVNGQYRTDLTGPFLRIVDNCGTIDESTTCSALDLGTSTGTDCTVPAGHSAGDTHSARTGFYELNRLIDQAKSWMSPTALPNASGGWMSRQLPANMNINNSCNAFFSPTDTGNPTTGSVNFYRDSISTGIGNCRNTGEIAAVFDHEWGHGLDTFDNSPGVSLPGEAYADMTAVMRLNTSCIGRGFFKTGTCPGNGDPCTQCTGVREIDWKKRMSGRPHDLAWVLGQNTTVPGSCGAMVVPPTPFNSGPCQRSTHCEGTIIGESMWDLLKRDLPCHSLRWETFAGGPVAGGRCTGSVPAFMDDNSALVLGTRLFYLAGGGVTNGYQCDTLVGGCNVGSWYLNMLAADDDDGVIANGTPHMVAIHDAFSRHGIACGAPPPTNLGCVATPAPAAPQSVNATAGTNSATITWSNVLGAAEYWVLRTDGVHGCDFGKTRVGRVPAGTLTFSESGLLDGLTYFYSVVAVGGAGPIVKDSCAGPMSGCAAVTPTSPGGASDPGLAVEDTGAAPVIETGDGDAFVDNCEVATLTFNLVNTGGVDLTNVQVTTISPSPAGTTILTLPNLVPLLGAGCGGTNSTAPVTFRFRAKDLGPQSTLTFTVVVEATGPGGPVTATGILTVEDTETDLVLGNVTFDFESGTQGWTAFSGTFGRSTQPPGGAQGTSAYMKSSSAVNDACDRARSPKVRLTSSSTLSLYNQFVTEPETPATPFYDRGNVGIVNAQGQRAIVSPSGGRPYNALNTYTGCNNGPGWATSVLQPTNLWALSTWDSGALNASSYEGQTVQVEVTYATDALTSLEGLQFDQVRLTNVLVQVADAQSDACPATNNHPPDAVDDSATTAEDTTVNIAVLANDSDPDPNQSLTITDISDPPFGTATIHAGGTIDYTPDPNYFGPDSFTYTITDGFGGFDTATVRVTVTAVNDRPDARDDMASTLKNTPVTIPVLANDVDPDGDTLNVRSFTQPTNNGGTVARSGTALRYTPRNNFVGTTTFDYTACDRTSGGLCDTARVTITVTAANRAPDAKDDAACTSKNQPVTINVLANDTDPDGNPLTVTVTQPPANGTAVRNANNTVTYTPRNNFVGADAFRYQACDAGGLCDTARVEVKVTRRPGCRDEDDDDHDNDNDRDDHDGDDDNDGVGDAQDPDDDNDGIHDVQDEDDDNDGIHDDFDSQSSRQVGTATADEAEPGYQVVHTVSAGADSLLVTALVEGPATILLAVDIYGPQGQLLAHSMTALGRAVAIAPAAAPGTYTVKVRNNGSAATGFSTTLIHSRGWPLP